MAIVAIAGYLYVGKDTFGKMLQYQSFLKKRPDQIGWDNYDTWLRQTNEYQYALSDWQINKFATKLKQILCLMCGCTMEQLEDQEFKKQKMPSEWDKRNLHSILYAEWQGYSDEVKARYKTTNGLHYSAPYYTSMTYREALQQLGTEALRNNFHENVHVNALFSDYKSQPKCAVWELEHPNEPAPYYHPHCDDCNKQFNGFKIQPYCKDCATVDRYPNWIITDPRFPSNEFKAIRERGGIIIRLVNGKPRQSDHISETSIDTYTEWDEVIDNSGSLEDLLLQAKRIVEKYNM